MEPYKIAVKIFTTGKIPPLASFIPIFHQWIRDQSTAAGTIPGHLLIDVADYAHVENGPGIVLVSSEANIYIDENGGRPGVLYVRKTPGAGTFADRLRSAVSATAYIADRLQNESIFAGRLKFDTGELQIRLNDRLLTPNNAQTLANTTPAFESLAQSVYPNQPVEVKSIGAPRDVFTIKLVAPNAPPIAAMIGAVGTTNV